MSLFSIHNKTKKTKTDAVTPSKKSGLKLGDLMVSRLHDNAEKNLIKKLLTKFRRLYLNHRSALITVTIVLLAGGGYVVYKSLAATPAPSNLQVYNYLRTHAEKYNAVVVAPGTEGELIGLPYANHMDGHTEFVYLSNPNLALDKNDPQPCFSPYTKETIKIVQEAERLSQISRVVDIQKAVYEGGDPSGQIVLAVTIAMDTLKSINAKSTKGLGEYIYCDGYSFLGKQKYGAVDAVTAARSAVRSNLEQYNQPDDHECDRTCMADLHFEPWYTCSKVYKEEYAKDRCISDDVNYPIDPKNAKKVVLPVVAASPQQFDACAYGLCKPDFDNLTQQKTQVALMHGATPYFLKQACSWYKDPSGCVTFIDQSCQYFNFCVGSKKSTINNPGFPPPSLPPPGPPPCDPRKGCDDSKWQTWPLAGNGRFWTNPRLPGRCIYKNSNGWFAVGINGADYDCNVLTQMYKCQNEFSKLDPKNPSTFANANISPECGNQSEIRGAGNFVLAYQLSQSVPKGNLEGNNSECTIQTGWAYSDANKNVPLEVHLYYDGPAGVGEKYIVKADVQRDDLKPFGNNGIHGFEFKIPDKYKDLKNHTVYMYPIGIQTNGWTNGKNPFVGQRNFSCDFPPQGNVERVYSGMENGTFQCKVQGWAFDRSDSNASLQVHAYIDGVPGNGYSAGAAIGIANIFRQDLKNAGQGNGKHGYLIDIPYKFRDTYKHKIRVYALGVFPFAVPNAQNPLIGEVDFQCDDPPQGSVDSLNIKFDSVTNTCMIAGWAFDPSSFWSTKVVVYYDFAPDFKTYGFLEVPFQTSVKRPDVKGYGGNYGFEYPIADRFFDDKPHKAYFYALNIDKDGTYTKQNNRFIGSKDFTCHKK